MCHKLWLSILLALFLVCALACNSQEGDRAALDARKQNIIAFAKSGICTGNSQCRYIGLGSKACGGPQQILVYSASLDTVKLLKMILQYNADEDRYNRKWGVISDCSLPTSPDSVVCLNGACVGYRNGVPKQ